MNIKEELNKLRISNGISKITECDKNEQIIYYNYVKNGNLLPKNIREHLDDNGQGTGTFYKIEQFDEEATYEDKIEFILLKQLNSINTIKKILIITIIASILGYILSINEISNMIR